MLNKFKRKFFELNLIFKLSAFFLTLLLFVTTLVYLYFPTRSREQQISMITKRIELASEITILFIQHSFSENDPELIKKAITPLKNNNEIEFYLLADSIGNFYEFDKIDYIKKYVTNVKSDTIYTSFDDKYIIKIKPIINNKKIVGYLGLGITLNQVNDYIFSLKRNIFVFVILLLGLGMYVIIVYSNFILKPLFILQNSIQNISEGKNADKVPIFFNDEIGQLTSNFNNMVDNLENANKNLKLEFKRKELTEKELLLTQKHLSETIEKQKELGELKTRFITMISHEYRTPLTAIVNSTYLIEQYAKRSDLANVEKYSTRIQASVQRLTKLLDDVLKVSKEENLSIDVKLEEVNLFDVCTEICDEMKLINDRSNIIVDIENIKLNMEVKLFQLISKNLISNSIKYSDKKTEVYYTAKTLNNRLVVTIKDFGIGMSKKDIDNLFEPFHRGENVGAIEGTGLGMSIIKESVDILSGNIEVKSELNNFTEFKITFPLVNNCMVINPNV